MDLGETGDDDGDGDGEAEAEGEGEADKCRSVKSHLKTFLHKNPDLQQQKQTRTRLIDNVNSYL